jgi:RNA polymerase sigma-70 factor (ECF subfamily)
VLYRALTQLSAKLRDVVILCYLEDLTLVEAAEQLSLPLGTVKRRLFEARTRLRQCVARF